MSSRSIKGDMPREHFSPTQLVLWEENPREYMRVYFEGGERPETIYMRYGKMIALALEKNIPTNDPQFEQVRIFLPVYPVREREMTAVIEVDGKPVKLLGRFDGYDGGGKAGLIGEIKTSTTRWTQERVDELPQLSFYDLLHGLNEGEARMELSWVPTGLIEGKKGVEVRTVGPPETWKTSRTKIERLKMRGRIAVAVREIRAAYKIFKKNERKES